MITRRQAMLAGAAAVGGGCVSAGTMLEIGAARLSTLRDGSLSLPAGFVFDPVPAPLATDMRDRFGLDGDLLSPPCNISLLRSGDRLVLFDCGAGAAFQPGVGRLPDALADAGVAAGDITDIVFTHGHPDHLWGVLDDFDDPAFPNARLWMGRAERDYWRDPDTVAAIGEGRAAFAVGAARRIAAVEDRIETFGDGDDLLPGITARLTPGHTPGHMSFRLSLGGADALLLGDAIGNHHVAFAHPAQETGNDQDMALAARTRLRLFDEIMADGLTVIGFHLPGGGIGQVDRQGDGFVFVPS